MRIRALLSSMLQLQVCEAKLCGYKTTSPQHVCHICSSVVVIFKWCFVSINFYTVHIFHPVNQRFKILFKQITANF